MPSWPIPDLRSLDTEAYKFYDSTNRLYYAALFIRVKKLAICTLRDLAAKLDVHSRHRMPSYFSYWPIQVLHSLDTEAYKFYDRTNRLYYAVLFTMCYTQNALRPFMDSKINPIRHFFKFLILVKEWTLLINRSFSEINRYNHPYQII